MTQSRHHRHAAESRLPKKVYANWENSRFRCQFSGQTCSLRIGPPIGSLIVWFLMSVGRKLFRLWIFATAGYILLASSLMFGWVRGEFVRAAFEEYGDAHAETLVPVACSSARGQAGVDYTKQQTWDKYLYATQSDNCWYPISKFRHLFPEYNDLSDDALIERHYTTSRP